MQTHDNYNHDHHFIHGNLNSQIAAKDRSCRIRVGTDIYQLAAVGHLQHFTLCIGIAGRTKLKATRSGGRWVPNGCRMGILGTIVSRIRHVRSIAVFCKEIRND